MNNLFFGAEIEAAWPPDMPKGRVIAPKSRHMTLAFLGKVAKEPLLDSIALFGNSLPSLAPCGVTNEIMLLPIDSKRVISLNVEWLSGENSLSAYHKELQQVLQEKQFTIDKRPFHAHIAIARRPFEEEQWQSWFSPFAFFLKSIHLYESHPQLHYEPLSSFPLHPPFEEIEHTADIAFRIYGRDLSEVHTHALLALSFKCPWLIPYLHKERKTHLDQIIMALNALIAQVDREEGCPFKAVSFHGEVTQVDILRRAHYKLMMWEMIVDV